VSECINHLPCGGGLAEFTVVLPNLFPEDLQDIHQLKANILDCFAGVRVNSDLDRFNCIGHVHSAYSVKNKKADLSMAQFD